jgi:hypothetical protein
MRKGLELAMKKIIPSLFVLMALLAGSSCMAAQVNVNSGMHVDWWDGDNGDAGLQMFIPFQVAGKSSDLSIELLGAYVLTEVNPDAGQGYTQSQMSDTKLNFSYGVYDKLPCDLMLGLGFNLPTGKTDFSHRQMVLIQPPDLFTLPYFGEGFNVNPTVAVAREWGTWVAGLGVGYNWRGEYDYNYDYQDYDPGDMVTLTGEVRKSFSDALAGKLYTQYITYAKDTLDGEDFYQEGDAKLVGLGLKYSSASWDLACGTSVIFRGKNKLRQGTAFPTESNNSHGDELNVGITHRYHLSQASSLVTFAKLLYITDNDYPAAAAYYVGKRLKTTLGCGIEKSLAKDVKAFAGVEGFLMDDDRNWYHPNEDVTYKGATFSAQVSKSF